MVAQTQDVRQQATLADFEAFIALPENRDRVFEFISGGIVAVPSNPFASAIAAKILILLGVYVLQKVQIVDANGALSGGSVLPGLSIAVQDIFPPVPSASS